MGTCARILRIGVAPWVLLGLLLVHDVHSRVLVIGIDGGSWNVVGPLMDAGEAPHLASIAARGVSADMTTVEPVTSPVVWTSVATGRTPAAHGVTDFLKTRMDVKVPTAYERLAQSGLKVGLYDVLMTWPPVSMPGGFVMPGWLRRDMRVTPPDLLGRVSTPIFRTIYDGKPRNSDYLEQAKVEVAQKGASWRALDRLFTPDVGAVTFYAVDGTSHRTWHAAYPDQVQGDAPPSDDERTAIHDAVRGVDRAIGEILADRTEEDTVIVVSDHGFRAADRISTIWVTDFEKAARAAGLDSERDGYSVLGTFFAVAIRIAPGPFAERDRTIDRLTTLLDSYQTEDGDPLFLTTVFDMVERPGELARPWTDRLWQWGMRTLTEDIFGTTLDPTAHAMVVALPRFWMLDDLWPDATVQVNGERMPMPEAMYRQRFTGTHGPTAIFMAAGGPVARVAGRGNISVLDVAPLLFYLSGRGIPDDLDGELPRWLLAPERLRKDPPEIVAAADFPGLSDQPAEPPFGDPTLVNRLRALGYLP